jgi:uncharacterized protein YfaS (alpha-2-macroglobulin family)
MVEYYDRGETYIVKMQVYDENGSLVDPDSATYKIIDSGENVKANGNMTKSAVGIYTAEYTIAEDDLTGEWMAECTAVLGSKTTIERIRFVVV